MTFPLALSTSSSGATSGTYSFSITRDDIIRNAMLTIGKIGDVEIPTASETKDCSMFLNMMVKQWMGKQDFAPGLKVWTRKRGNLFLSNSTGTYSLGPTGDHWTNQSYQRSLTATANSSTLPVSSIANVNAGDYILVELDSGALFASTVVSAAGSSIVMNAPVSSQASSGAVVYNYSSKAQRPLRIVTASLRDSNVRDVPLTIMNVEDYERLPTKSDTTYQGDPVSILYESTLNNGTLSLDVGSAQDVTKYIHMTYFEPIQDFNNPGDVPEYPQQWYLALSLGLSKLICPIFNAVWTPEMEDNFKTAMAMAREEDSEGSSLYFNPGNDGLTWAN